MSTRRKFLSNGLGAGAAIALGLPGMRSAYGQDTTDEEARNKATVRLFKESQGTPDYADVLKQVQSPDYVRLRAGFENLATNARGTELEAAAQPVGSAIPDRADTIEQMIADGDMVGMLFRVRGTHEGNFFGIPATGRSVDFYEIGILKLADGKIVEGWFMADEAALLKQLGTGLPVRADGKRVVPKHARSAPYGQVALEEIMAHPVDTQTWRNKRMVSAYKSASPPPGILPDRPGRVYDEYLRGGFQHLVNYGAEHGVGDQSIGQAFPDRVDKVDHVLAEGSNVWIQFRLTGTNTQSLYGMPPSNSYVEVTEIGIMTFDGARWKTGWFFGDEIGMLLQLGQPTSILTS